MAATWVDLFAGAKARLDLLGADLARTPEEALRVSEAVRAALMTGAGVRGVTYFAILLFVGIAVEWLYWTYAYSPLRAVQAARPATPVEALRLAWRRLLLLACGMLLFTVAAAGTSAAFSWPQGVQELVVAAALLLLALRFSWAAIDAVLAPGRPAHRLVPVAPERACRLAALGMAALTLLAIGHFVPAMLERALLATHVPGALRFGLWSAAALLLVAIAFAAFGRGRAGGTSATQAALFPRSFLLAVLVIAVYAVWIANPAAAALAAIVAIVLALLLGLRGMVYFYWGEGRGAAPAIVLSVARFLVVLAGIGAGALALEAPIGELAQSVNPWARITLRALGVAVLALLAHGVWIAVRSVVDERLARVRPADPHHPADAGSRLLTLLPLLRVTTAVVLLVLLVLSSLWALGIEITPLLAGAGVVGLAVGFGAQALVRDVIAGIFFLAEDAFRVGEYIESGTNTKGTVERITLRSVALRHHNGPLHFVPYGSLGTVRNTSRDWVIDKFNLPLPIDVESEKIRKMIKKVGEDLKADPEIGPLMIEPLKGKLYRIDPGVKLFRCKFRSPPGKQFDVRAAALRRIEAALKAMGVGFADGRHTVLLAAPAVAPGGAPA
jgi:small-conductance mechanosensitive channel